MIPAGRWRRRRATVQREAERAELSSARGRRGPARPGRECCVRADTCLLFRVIFCCSHPSLLAFTHTCALSSELE